ncbi:MAG TPA: UbiH/UbiF/VisC/COQ6 family ubiquinone biosynthesis hydroxylase [Azospirillaceae bacterium]|nr:UbiH/UbiF/VisC/COQ6 family ubiquinone biosynthesis hydroxylase [Azospirillaceae bacterium]
MGADASQELTTEVIIVGGGPAGLTMACALATAGVPTVCIDRDPPEKQSADTFDYRTTAIAYGAERVLEGAGIWKHLESRAAKILDIRVVDGGSPFFLHYDHRDAGAHFGTVAENRDIRLACFNRVKELPGLTHLTPATVASLTRGRSGVTVNLTDGRVVKGRLIIGADGRKSPCREDAGIKLISWRYGQTAIICNIAHSRPHHGLAVERFLPSGPFALLPLTGDRTSIVWSEREDRVAAYMTLPEDEFVAEIRRRAGGHLGDIRLDSPRDAWPLSVLLAERFVDERLALIGEAAHAIHPVAGQGLNLSFRDIAALAEVIVDTWRLGLDIGSPEVLARYQRWRRFDTLTLLAVCDSLVRLFSNDIPPLRLARDLGMAAINRVPPLKKVFMRHAMGLVGDLPRMIKGEAL